MSVSADRSNIARRTNLFLREAAVSLGSVTPQSLAFIFSYSLPQRVRSYCFGSRLHGDRRFRIGPLERFTSRAPDAIGMVAKNTVASVSAFLARLITRASAR